MKYKDLIKSAPIILKDIKKKISLNVPSHLKKDIEQYAWLLENPKKGKKALEERLKQLKIVVNGIGHYGFKPKESDLKRIEEIEYVLNKNKKSVEKNVEKLIKTHLRRDSLSTSIFEFIDALKAIRFSDNNFPICKGAFLNKGFFKDCSEWTKCWGWSSYTTEEGLRCYYVGEYKNGEFHGKGTIIYQDGQVYNGDFKNGIKNGYGTSYSINGGKYVGEIKNDKYHGKGTYTSANGSVAKGIWKNNKLLKKN